VDLLVLFQFDVFLLQLGDLGLGSGELFLERPNDSFLLCHLEHVVDVFAGRLLFRYQPCFQLLHLGIHYLLSLGSFIFKTRDRLLELLDLVKILCFV